MARHNYEIKLKQMLERGEIKPGEVTLAQINHDDWCGVFCGKYCNCDPEIVVKPAPAGGEARP